MAEPIRKMLLVAPDVGLAYGQAETQDIANAWRCAGCTWAQRTPRRRMNRPQKQGSPAYSTETLRPQPPCSSRAFVLCSFRKYSPIEYHANE